MHKYRITSLLLLLVAALLSMSQLAAAQTFNSASAQVNWFQASSPSPRCCMGIVFDPGTHSALLFGGVQGYYSAVGDTWKLGEIGWFQLSPTSSPPPREGPGMAYDEATRTVVLFGGSSGFGGYDFNDTWIWDGVTWTQVFPGTSPPGRHFDAPGMTYDAAAGKVVLFGGVTGSTVLGDTWTWDGETKTWTQHFPSVSPSPRTASMAYDGATGTVILFGGLDGTNTFLGDTWVWNGRNWHQRLPATSPPPRNLPAMAYDRNLERVVLFGGYNGGIGYNDTWTWDGTTWTQVSTTTMPPDRYAFGMYYDPRAKSAVLFGGFSFCCGIQGDTWKLANAP
jgi:hypothetical protein